ncbi:MAG: ABC transporter substrate-binding protein [Nitrospira bacterium HGW-Nitrospira-1]|nr:MAG: ABC transporter substrate-binding protein [Nitrospira bacterium HGW-Nitrospira-1]
MQSINAGSFVFMLKLKMSKIAAIFLFFIIIIPLHTAFAAVDKIKVVATITPLADFAKQVGGDKIEVILLLPPGASPHTYEPTPKIIRAISEAKIFLKIGTGLEFWADRIIKTASAKISIVDSSAGVDLIKDTRHSHHSGHNNHGNADPHIWLDPLICMEIIKKIETALSKADPLNALYYRKNAAAYCDKLRKLDKEIADKTKLFRNREYVTFHSAWNYFSRRYGLKVAAVIEEGPGKEPSPRHIKKIMEELKRFNTRVIFAEPQFSPKIAETIAREAGAQVLFLDPIGGQKDKETYIEMMQYNLAIMAKALK